MSDALDGLQPTEDDITKMLMATTHLGTKNTDHQMRRYVFKRRADTSVNIIDLHHTWEKMMLAARVLVAIENPKDICAISGRPYGMRAVLKFAKHTGSNSIAGRYTPGTFTNQIQKAYIEPRILVVTDPRHDHQPVRESSYVNLPVIALCNTDSPLRFVDIAIPCNNAAVNSIGLMWWFLAREMLQLRGTIARRVPWEIMPDLYFYRDPEEVEAEEQAAANAAEADAAAAGYPPEQWDAAAGGVGPDGSVVPAGDWEASGAVPVAAVPAVGGAPVGVPFGAPVATEQWGGAATGDWNAGAY
jgi:small subunit ribosomal protein SAe